MLAFGSAAPPGPAYPLSGLIQTFGGFAVGHEMRSTGGLPFGHLGDPWGASWALQRSKVVNRVETEEQEQAVRAERSAQYLEILVAQHRLARLCSQSPTQRAQLLPWLQVAGFDR